MSKNPRFLILLLSLIVTACSSTPDEDGIYKLSTSTASLEVPPDLVLPASNEDFIIPGIASQQKTYSVYSGADAKQAVLPKTPKGIRLVREGNQAWLEVKASPTKLWSELKIFLQKLGFELKRKDKLIGLLETNWVERKGETGGWFSDTVGVMDKFRVRLERSEKNNMTLVFIRHRGMSGSRVDTGEEDRTVWQPRASDSELEVELLQQFLVFRGLSDEQVQKLAAKKKQQQNSRIATNQEGRLILNVAENFARTWRRVGLALDRMGLIIDDRNRSAGVYYVRVPDTYELDEEKGWFAGLFAGDDASGKVEYLLSVAKQGDNSVVTVRKRASATIDATVAKKILTRIQAHIS